MNWRIASRPSQGAGQIGRAGQGLPELVVVRVVDPRGQPVPGATVPRAAWSLLVATRPLGLPARELSQRLIAGAGVAATPMAARG